MRTLFLVLILGQAAEPPIPSLPLVPRKVVDPVFKAKSKAGEVVVSREHLGVGEDALGIRTKRGELSCTIYGNLHCADRVEVEEQGGLLLVCVPHFGKHEACEIAGSPELELYGRTCVLVDVGTRHCHQLWGFNDAHLTGPRTLSLDKSLDDQISRYPKTLEELAEPQRLECPQPPPPPLPARKDLFSTPVYLRGLSSHGPTQVLRGEVDYAGDVFRLVKSLGVLQEVSPSAQPVPDAEALESCEPAKK